VHRRQRFLCAQVETVCDRLRSVSDSDGRPRTLADSVDAIPTSRWGLPRRTTQRHDAFMRLPWNTPKLEQLDLVDEASAGRRKRLNLPPPIGASNPVCRRHGFALVSMKLGIDGRPLLRAPSTASMRTSGNPRTEFPDQELAERPGHRAARNSSADRRAPRWR
jgi:hypothetical protein